MKNAPEEGWIVVVARNIEMGADYVRTLGIPLSECLIITPRTGHLKLFEGVIDNNTSKLLHISRSVEQSSEGVWFRQFVHSQTGWLYWAANEDVELG